MAQGPGSTRQNNGPFAVGGFYNFAPFTLVDGQACALQFDINGNLKVTSTGGGGGGSNPAAGPTGAPVPADADYLGINIGGTLFGVTGFNLTDSTPIAVAIVNANGDQITSFGGGSQFAMGSAQSASALGTIALGYDGTNVRGLLVSSTGQLHTIIDSALPAGSNLIGQVEITDGTNILFTSGHAGYVQFPSAQAVTLTSTTITGNVSVTQAAASNPWIVAGGGTAGAPGTAVLTVQGIGSGTPIPVSGSVAVTFPTSPIVWIEGSTGVVLDSAAGTPNAQAITIQGNSSGVSVPVAGKLTHNNAAPVATQIGVLPALANAAAPTYNEGDQVLLSTDLTGNLRVSATVSFSAPQHVIVDSGSITVSGTVGISGTVGVTQSTSPWVIAGGLTNNNAAPSTNNVGVLPAVATTTPPTDTTGDQVLLSTDLAGNLRVANQSIQSIVQKASNVSTGSVSSLVKAFNSGNALGNSIVVVCSVGNISTPTITDSNGNTYTAVNAGAGGALAFSVIIFLATNIAAGANTVTFHNGGTAASMAMEIYEVQGVLTTPYVIQSLDAKAINSTTSTSVTIPTFNSSQANEIVFAGIGVGTAAQTITPASPYVNDSGQLNPVTPSGLFSFASLSTYINTIGQSVTPSIATLAGSEPWSVVVVSFLPYTQGVNGTVNSKITGNSGLPLDSILNTGTSPNSGLWIQPAPSNQAAAALTPKYVSSTAAQILKASSGNLYGVWMVNLADTTSTTVVEVMYLHFFNTTTTTGLTTASWLFALPIPAGTQGTVGGTGTGRPLSLPPGALALGNFSSGIVVLMNTTSTSNTTASGTNPVGVVWIE